MKRLSPQDRSNQPSLKSSNKVTNASSVSSRIMLQSNNKPEGSKINNGNSVSNRIMLQGNSKPKGSKISNGSSVSNRITLQSNRPEGSKTSNANSVSNGTTSQGNSKPEGNRINNASSVSSRTTGQPTSGALLRFTGSRSLGRVLVHIVGSPNTAHGSSAAATEATAFRTTVSVATMARITDSAFTVSL